MVELLAALALFTLSSMIDQLFKTKFKNIHYRNRINFIFNVSCILMLALCLLSSQSLPIDQMHRYFRGFLLIFTVQQLLISPILFLFHVTQSMILSAMSYFIFISIWTRGLEYSLENFIIRMGVVGVVLMAGLSAFGAVSTPFNNLKAFKINVDEKVLDSVKRQLQTSIDMVLIKKKYLIRNAESTNSFWGKFNFYENSDSLESEIRNLNLFVDDLYLDLIDLHNQSESHRFGQTIAGRVMNILGYIFSGVCVFKVLNSLFQLSFKRIGLGEGPVTKVLTLIAESYHVELDVSYWSNVLSLILIAALMMSSIRSFLLQSLKVFRYFRPLEKNIVLILFSQLIGLYSLSMILMLRSNLPKESNSRILLRKIVNVEDFAYHQQWYDFVFVLTCFISIVIMGMELRLRVQKYQGQKQWID